MEIPLLNDILIIFILAIVVLFICHQFRIPAVVGFLITGVLTGPYGFGLVRAVTDVDKLAEIGVVLLLFTIGIEFSLERMMQIRKSVLLGGSLQLLLTFAAAFFVSWRFFGQAFNGSVFLGFVTALSSTVIVLKLLQERAEIDSPHGRTVLSILIFQDIITVPMILVTPFLAGGGDNSGLSLVILTGKGIGIILLVWLVSKWVIPGALYQITRTRNRELFLMSVVAIFLGVAWLTSKAGLSLALGAFLAGLVISESEYSHQALGNILPFKDLFTTFFFISVGMLLDIGFVLRQPLLIVSATILVLLAKTIIVAFVSVLLGLPLRSSILAGLAICQIGEFSFILAKTGVKHGLMQGQLYQVFLAVSVLGMAATPFLIAIGPRLADIILRLSLPARLLYGLSPLPATTPVVKRDHLIIIGFGINGRNLANAAKEAGISYDIIEMNPETVRSEAAKEEPIFYGDATHENVLHHANIKYARVIVVAINDAAATRRIATAVRKLNPKAHLIVRTRFIREMEPLARLGANEVIPEEFETSLEIFVRVLVKYAIPKDEIEKLVTGIRSESYHMFRSLQGAQGLPPEGKNKK